MIIVTKGDNTQAWCTMCDSEAPVVVEVAEDVFGCEECLGEFMRELRSATTAEVFGRQLRSLAQACCIDGGVVEVRGATLDDAHQYGGKTTDTWPVVYGTLDEPALRPDELRLLTPAAQIVVRAGRPSEVSIGYVDGDTASLVVDVDGQGTG